MHYQLRKHQIENVNFITSRQYTLLADMQGCGKTLSTLAAWRRYGQGKMIVICPPIAVSVWEEEIKKFSPGVKVNTAPTEKSTPKCGDKEVLILTYSILSNSRILTLLEKMKFDFLVFDEAHNIKNPSATRSDHAAALCDVNRHAPMVFLTGTPVTQNVMDFHFILYECMKNVLPQEFRTRASFRKRFLHESPFYDRKGFLRKKLLQVNTEELRYLLQYVLIRHLLTECEDMPPLTYSVIPFKKPKKVDTVLKDIYEKVGSEPAYIVGQATNVATERKLLSEYKIPVAIEYIKEQIKSGCEKIIVFGFHINVIDAIAKAFPHSVVLYGATTKAKREAAIDKFKNDPNCKILVANYISAGVAITLTNCHKVIFAESSWTWSENEQAVYRAYRMGQKNKVSVDFLVFKNDIDNRVLKLSLQKYRNAKEIYKMPELTITQGGKDMAKKTQAELIKELAEEVTAVKAVALSCEVYLKDIGAKLGVGPAKVASTTAESALSNLSGEDIADMATQNASVPAGYQGSASPQHAAPAPAPQAPAAPQAPVHQQPAWQGQPPAPAAPQAPVPQQPAWQGQPPAPQAPQAPAWQGQPPAPAAPQAPKSEFPEGATVGEIMGVPRIQNRDVTQGKPAPVGGTQYSYPNPGANLPGIDS